MAALVVLMLTLGSIALQVLSGFSWQLTRTVVDRRLAAGVALSVAAGVVLPLWMSTDPVIGRTRLAFAAAGWSALILMASAWTVASRINPVALANRTCTRTLRLLNADWRGRPDEDPRLLAASSALGELVGSRALPPTPLRTAVVAHAAVLAVRGRAGDDLSGVEAQIRSLADIAHENLASSQAKTIVVVLGALGIGTPSWGVHGVVRSGLLRIAQQARTAGMPSLADEALDALLAMADSITKQVLPVFRSPGRVEDRTHDRTRPESARNGEPTSLGALIAVIQGGDVTSLEVAAAFAALRRMPYQPDEEERSRRGPSARDVEPMLEDTVAALRALLPSPSPESEAWPSGWQGTGSFDRDVLRIAQFAQRPYARGQYPGTNAVEETLEEIGSLLRNETARHVEYPQTRTSWRDYVDFRPRGSPTTTTLTAQADLAAMAFQSGFDRRALLTGRRILAAATTSARAGDLPGLKVAAASLERVTSREVLRIALTEAGERRQAGLLVGLLAESDQLLACAEEPGCQDSIDKIIQSLVATAQAETRPRATFWQSQVFALGWPVPVQDSLREFTSREPIVVHPLPERVVAIAKEAITWSSDPGTTATAVTAVWVHAACNLRAEDGREAQQIAAFLTDQTRKDRGRLFGPSQLSPEYYQPGRLIMAAIGWCESSDLTTPLDVPPSFQPESLAEMALRIAENSDPPRQIYRGCFIDGAEAVIIDEPDGSQRLLRDAELRARGTFTWGYRGRGPSDLAEALITDILDPHTRCPACLGAVLCGADMVHCATCDNIGLHPDVESAAAALVETFVHRLSKEHGWQLEASTLLTHLADSQAG
jgi:hypothetical protein